MSNNPAGGARPPTHALLSNVLVDVDDRQHAHDIDVDHLSMLLSATLGAQRGDGDAEVGLAFVDVDEMTELNTAYMGGTGPTDVLAFPIDGVDVAGGVPDGQPAMLGDIVICPVVAESAPQELADELALLVVHGALHLVGHDHAESEETTMMKALEVDMLDRFHRS
jgi:probable rRNA maturation factor